MVHLSWNMARNIKVSEHKLFEMIKWVWMLAVLKLIRCTNISYSIIIESWTQWRSPPLFDMSLDLDGMVTRVSGSQVLFAADAQAVSGDKRGAGVRWEGDDLAQKKPRWAGALLQHLWGECWTLQQNTWPFSSASRSCAALFQVEVFNLLFVTSDSYSQKSSVVQCQDCARKGSSALDGFVVLEQFRMEDLMQVYDQFSLVSLLFYQICPFARTDDQQAN